MAKTYDSLPNISVNLKQVRAVDANITIPFNATVVCKTKTGPINEFTQIKSYTEAVQLFGLGDATTPALFGAEQVLRNYGYLNFIRIASAKAAKGTIALTIADEQDPIITGESDYCTDLFNGDEIKLHYEKARNRLAIRGNLNGINYSTPLEIIDLSTATAQDVEAVLDKLVDVWNLLESGVTLTNKYINKLESDTNIVTPTALPAGTIELGNCGNTEELSDDYIIETLQLIEDPKITRQDVVICPEFRSSAVVNAGLALTNKYFYLVSAPGSTLAEKQDAIQLFDQSDEGVCYIPSKCIMGDETITVPFECAALYAWANSYKVSRYLAPAGTNRATIPIVTDILDSLNDLDAEAIYNFDIPANHVKYISNYGYTLYGQKTMDPTQEFTNRVNVSGLVNYIQIEGKNLLAPYLFEYTPISTFEQVYMDLTKMLDVLVSSSVINSDYKVICDDSNNTEKTLSNHELHAYVAIRPVNVVEYIYLDLTVTDEIQGGVE